MTERTRPAYGQQEEPGVLAGPFRAALESLRTGRAVGRLFARDATLWKTDASHQAIIRNRLGWIDAPLWLGDRVRELSAFGAEIRAAGFTRILLCGMGGSSLAPEVFARVSKHGPGAPGLHVLDTTDPAAVARIEAGARLDRTFFLIASKSGSTIETRSQYAYFRARLEAEPSGDVGDRFAAITDEGSPLDEIARESGFRRVFRNPPDIGGRYSALSYFGMVPAALLGLDLERLRTRALAARENAESGDLAPNEAVRLGAFLGCAAMAGRDKLTLLTSPSLRPLAAWIEQLVAESTGKEGSGILPIEGEPAGTVGDYGEDRAFAFLRLGGEESTELDALEEALREARQPLIRCDLEDRDEITGTFYRWEVATALAGSILGVNPFDEPNVEESKDVTRSLLEDREGLRDLAASAGRERSPAQRTPRVRAEGIEVDAADRLWAAITAGTPGPMSLELLLRRFLAHARPGDYVAMLAFLERTAATEAAFASWRHVLRDALRVPVLQGYGPRYLHSIGQLYKGGPKRGHFIYLTGPDVPRLEIPGAGYTFGDLERAQALGDALAMERRGRPAIRLHLTGEVAPGLRLIGHALERVAAALATPPPEP